MTDRLDSKNERTADAAATPRVASGEGSHESHRHVRPWQFGIRGLLLLTLGASVVFAVMRLFGPLGQVAIGWILVMAVGHVWATVTGSHLRRKRRTSFLTRVDDSPATSARLPKEQVQIAIERTRQPATRLSQQSRLGLEVRYSIYVGAVVGGIVGSALLLAAYHEQGVFVGVLIGGGSAAVIGGFFGFMASSCYIVARTAWREASESASPDTRGLHRITRTPEKPVVGID